MEILERRGWPWENAIALSGILSSLKGTGSIQYMKHSLIITLESNLFTRHRAMSSGKYKELGTALIIKKHLNLGTYQREGFSGLGQQRAPLAQYGEMELLLMYQ